MYSIKQKNNLIKQFTIREVASRYKNSFLGILWSFITPILMLIVYSFVFTQIFQSRWDVGIDSKINFALMLFCALNTYQIFSESIAKAPNLILNNQNYVTKVVFPLEILPISNVLSSLVNSFIGFLILISTILVVEHSLPVTVLLLPFILFPLVVFSMAFSFILSALGVFIRDIGQTIAIALNVLFFLTPIFYPISAVPERFQIYLKLNPLTLFIEQTRSVIVVGELPDFTVLAILYVLSILLFLLGNWIFMKCRRLFNDVL